MKRFLIPALISCFLLGCPGQDNSQPATPPWPVPHVTAPPTASQAAATPQTIASTYTERPSAITVFENQISTTQDRSTRTIIDFNLDVTDNMRLNTITGSVISNDPSATGEIMLEVDQSYVNGLDLSTLQNGQFSFNFITRPLFGSSFRLSEGRHHVKVLVRSTHGTGDTLQGEIHMIDTDLTSSRVVFRWPAVLCD